MRSGIRLLKPLLATSTRGRQELVFTPLLAQLLVSSNPAHRDLLSHAVAHYPQ